jgi:carboxypeptidase C (cathepsin A)
MRFKPLNALAVRSLSTLALWTLATAALAAAPEEKAEESESPRFLKDESQVTQATITVGGHPLVYQAEAGLLVVHVKDPMDDDPPRAADPKGPPPPQAPEASMSYVAYFKGDHEDIRRPVTFLFNGGPGSSTVWLHMGAFGPKRVVTSDDTHSPGAPYKIVDNQFTLLDVSDLVFVDAPGTGFGHLRGTDKEKAFFGVDADAHAFANFIVEFLSRHSRWNSAKYLFGESYGTTRAAVLAHVLQNDKSLDFNGIILLSQILSFANDADGPQFNPGVDQPYVLVLPTYAASAWYHKKLAQRPPTLEPLLAEAERFATGEYAQALAAGSALAPERKAEIAAKIHELTGLPADYVERANLRVNAGEFEKTLQGADVTTGRLDSRFSGPTIDPMSKEADYDPQSAAISSAYVSAFNDYVRRTLRFGDKKTYKPFIQVWKTWNYSHRPPDSADGFPGSLNVMLDLARAMQENPNLKVQMNGGYYDLATPYFGAAYELRHLPMQAALQANIETHFYESGHMVYAHEPSLEALHANVAAFIAKTRGASAP